MARFKKKKARRKGRARAATRRVGIRARRFARRMRGRSLGLVGKTGVGIAAGAPLLGAGIEAAAGAIGEMRAKNVGLMGTANIAFWRFLNGLSLGFGMGQIADHVTVFKTDGTFYETPAVQSRIPAGAWFKTSVIGGTLIAWDILTSWASRKLAGVSSGIRFMGTKLTGGK